jgi:hypothetical protein
MSAAQKKGRVGKPGPSALNPASDSSEDKCHRELDLPRGISGRRDLAEVTAIHIRIRRAPTRMVEDISTSVLGISTSPRFSV